MQLMTWTIARLGSRFNLLFEPYHRRVMHSALGRFLDQPLDLMVGLVEPDGTRRVLPFTADSEAVDLSNAEQFERFNSITYRGYSEKYNLRFEFNVHSVFYPQDERLCVMPAIYLEMRVCPVSHIRDAVPVGPVPDKVDLFIRLRRPQTQITARQGDDEQPAQVSLAYRHALTPRREAVDDAEVSDVEPERSAQVHERIVSLNPDCTCLPDGDGLGCQLPVTEENSGIKWRLIWAAHVDDPILTVSQEGQARPAHLHYRQHWADVDQVVEEAIQTRDDRLAYSRRLEKILEQAPIDVADRHLLNQTFQSWLSNTFWCDIQQPDGSGKPWFAVWEGSRLYLSSLDDQYNGSLVYLSLWPALLAMQLDQWAQRAYAHEASGGCCVAHNLGSGTEAGVPEEAHAVSVEQNCNFLLMLQAYVHWTADESRAREYADLIDRLACYLVWSDRDASGFPSEGVGPTLDDGSIHAVFSRKHTYLGIKRAAALRAASDLLAIAKRDEAAVTYRDAAEQAVGWIESQAWLTDHYAVCVERMAVGEADPWSGKRRHVDETILGWDAYSIHTGNGLVLPMLIGQPPLLDEAHIKRDLASAIRENFARYGCGHTSLEIDHISVSQNLWRDHLATYLHVPTLSGQSYWDLQVMSNTHQQSMGYSDTYIHDCLSFHPRGITSIGKLLSGPRLIIDRLAAGGTYVTVDPDRHVPQRWPLLPLADWVAGKVPVCVVNNLGQVSIEGQIDPVIVQGQAPANQPSKSGLIG